MNKNPRYSRRLSAMERYSLVIDAAYRYHVDGVVEGVGDIEPALLQAAVDKAAEANPGVRVRLKGVLGFCRWVDSGIAPVVHVVNGNAWDGASDSNSQFMAQRLGVLEGGPVADVLLVHGCDQRTRLVFRGLHAALDGRGMMHWMLEVFRALRGEALHGSNSTLTDLDIQAQFRDSVVIEPPAAPVLCLPVLPPTPKDEPLAYVWRRVIIGRNVSSLLPKTAVFLADWARKQGAGEVGFTVPVDYRGLRTDEMSVGNLTGYLRLTVAAEDTAKTLMQQLNQKIRHYADCKQFPGARVLLWIPVRYMLKKLLQNIDSVLYSVSPGLPSGGIVSMGSLKNDYFSCAGFTPVFAYGIPGSVGKLNVVFVNYADSTIVTFAAPKAYNNEGQLDALAHAFQTHFSAAQQFNAVLADAVA